MARARTATAARSAARVARAEPGFLREEAALLGGEPAAFALDRGDVLPRLVVDEQIRDALDAVHETRLQGGP